MNKPFDLFHIICIDSESFQIDLPKKSNTILLHLAIWRIVFRGDKFEQESIKSQNMIFVFISCQSCSQSCYQSNSFHLILVYLSSRKILHDVQSPLIF